MISCDAKRTPTTQAILILRGAAGKRHGGFLRKLEDSPEERGISEVGGGLVLRILILSRVQCLGFGISAQMMCHMSDRGQPDTLLVPWSGMPDGLAG